MNLIKALKVMSIKRKLMLIMMATSGTAIFLMALLVVINQAINSQHAIEQQLITLADVLGSRSTGALTFDDPDTGEEILNGLVLKSNVVYAVIEHANGEPFAMFGSAATSSEYQSSQLVSLWGDLFVNRIQVSRDIYLDKERIGQIRIVSTLDALYKDLLSYLFFLAIISVFCFAVIFFFCAQLQKLISIPILNLQKTMNIVSTKKDYSLRVKSREENELKSLIEGFNHMLEQIQIRDNQLAKNSIHLEEIAAVRSQQLSSANEKRILWLESMARFLKHELKNSSVGIKTSLDLIERRSTEKKKVDVYIARARKSMMAMNALLQSAGEASHLEASLYKESQERLDLGKIVLGHIDSYSLIYPDIFMHTDCQLGLNIAGNEMRLMQLLDKLVSNAVEHCDAHAPIDIRVKRLDGMVQLIVADKGDALPEDKMAIFDLFVSFRTAERQTDDNFGLGLYVVKLIVESHGGQVKAYDPEHGKGAIIEVTLPLINDN